MEVQLWGFSRFESYKTQFQAVREFFEWVLPEIVGFAYGSDSFQAISTSSSGSLSVPAWHLVRTTTPATVSSSVDIVTRSVSALIFERYSLGSTSCAYERFGLCQRYFGFSASRLLQHPASASDRLLVDNIAFAAIPILSNPLRHYCIRWYKVLVK